jgi:hypothetical protein
MTEKKGYFEKLAERMDAERRTAGVRELKRRIAAGEFPDNDDTIKAFSAGFYTAFAYRADAKKASEGAADRPFSMMLFMVGGLLVAGNVISLLANPANIGHRAIFVPFLAAGFIAAGVWSHRRANRSETKLHDDFKEKWG